MKPLHLPEHVAHVQQFRRHLEASFLRADPSRPRTSLYKRLRTPIKEAFESFRAGMRKVEKFVSGRSLHHLEEGCQEAGQALAKIRDLMAELGNEEAAFPQPESAVEEVLAVLDFYDQGALDAKSVVARAEELRSRSRHFREDVALGAKKRSEDLNAPTARGCRHLVQLEHSLDSLISHVRGERLTDVAELRRELKALGEKLRQDYEQIMSVLNPPAICAQCGASNPFGQKLCSACGARLLSAIGGEVASSTFSTIEEGEERPRPRFAYLVQVEETIEAFLAGECDMFELQGIIEWFAGRVQGGHDRYKQLAPPLEISDARERSEADAIRASFEKGSAALLACVKELQRFLVEQDRECLSRALDSLRQGESLIGEAQAKLSGGS